MVNSNNYVNIQGWMLTSLNLKGNELIVYATIYGFSQDGVNWFEGNTQYLADWCNASKRNILEVLKSLVNKGFIIKDEYIINNIKFCKYRANLDAIRGGEESSPNNIYNILNKKEKDISKKKKGDMNKNE